MAVHYRCLWLLILLALCSTKFLSLKQFCLAAIPSIAHFSVKALVIDKFPKGFLLVTRKSPFTPSPGPVEWVLFPTHLIGQGEKRTLLSNPSPTEQFDINAFFFFYTSLEETKTDNYN